MISWQVVAKLCTKQLVRTLLLVWTLPIFAQPQITLSESELKLSGPYNQGLSCTFSVLGKSLPEFTPLTRDLIGAKTGALILSTNLTVTPIDEAANNRKKFTVTINAAPRPDLYSGELELYEKDAAKPAAKVKLRIDFKPVPVVDAESKDKSIIVSVRQDWDDLPYVVSDTTQSTLTEERINLIQSAEGDAEVEEARVLSMRGTEGRTLPVNAVRVTSAIPLTIAQPVRIGVAGQNLPAGEYSGMIYIKIRDQTLSIQIPLIVKIKHGPLAAVLLLALGFLAVFLFGWWKDEGKGKRGLVKEIQNLAKDIRDREDGKLQADERDEAFKLVKQAMEAVEAGEPFAEAKKKFDAAQNFITAARAEADKLINEVLEPLWQETKGLVPGENIRAGFLKKLEELKKSIVQGQHQNLKDARELLENKSSGLKAKIGYFRVFVDKLNAAEIPDDKRETATEAFDRAETVMDLRQALSDAGVEPPPLERGKSFEPDRKAPSGSADSDRLELSLKRRWQLYGGGIVVMLVAYLFLLAVGFITLYAKSATFGADPMDYVYLFLWGSTIETVRGGTIDLTSFQTIVKEKTAAGN